MIKCRRQLHSPEPKVEETRDQALGQRKSLPSYKQQFPPPENKNEDKRYEARQTEKIVDFAVVCEQIAKRTDDQLKNVNSKKH